MADVPPAWARDFAATARVGRLATSSSASAPHVIPVCFVLLEDTIFSVIDEKPKSGRRLLRLRNIDQTGRAALVVDEYHEDWTQLAFVLMRGPARTITTNAIALEALREKYPQYRDMALEGAEMVEMRVERWTAWRG